MLLRTTLIIPLASALAAMVVYVITLAPEVTGEDSGELIATAYTLGIPHPPGYPLWCLIAHVFTWIPLHTVAWRVHLMSAVFAAGTVCLTVLMVQRWTRNAWSAVAAGLSLAFGSVFWEHALIAEVYSLNVFCVALCVWLLSRWRETGRLRPLCGFGVVYGLGLGNHSTMLLLGMLFVGYVVLAVASGRSWGARRDQRDADSDHAEPPTYPCGSRGGAIPHIALALASVALGALVYLYLPLRSLADPPVDWGDPESWSNFWRVVTREQYAFMYSEYPRSLARYLRQLWDMAVLWGEEFTPPVSVLGVLGLATLIHLRRWEGTLIALIALVVPASAAWVQNFEHDFEWLSVMRVFGIPAYWATAVGLGCGLAALAKRGRYGLWIARALAILCIAAPLCAHWQRNDRSQDVWARTYGLHLLDLLPQNALYIPETDQDTFPVLYLQVVEGLRPDVTLGRKYGYLEASLYADMPQAQHTAIGPFPRGRDEAPIFDWLLRHAERPVYFERPPALPPDGAWRFVPHGFLYRALREDESWNSGDPWDFYPWDKHRPEEADGNYEASLILFTFGLCKARDALREADTDDAAKWTTYALDAYGREPKSLNSAGVVWAKAGAWETACGYFDAALALDPDYAPALRNRRQVDTARDKQP